MRRAMLAFALFAMTIALGASKAHAVLFAYAYKGNDFTVAQPPYTTSDFVSAEFTVDLPTNIDLTGGNLQTSLTAFSMSDGVQTLTLADAPFTFLIVIITTDSFGDILQWQVTARTFTGRQIATTSFEGDGGTTGPSAFGLNAGINGTWRQVAPVAAPSTLALLASGLAALIFVTWRRRRAVTGLRPA